VTHCANCERPLCAKHAVPQLTDTGEKSGMFMCKDCSVAHYGGIDFNPGGGPSGKK